MLNKATNSQKGPKCLGTSHQVSLSHQHGHNSSQFFSAQQSTISCQGAYRGMPHSFVMSANTPMCCIEAKKKRSQTRERFQLVSQSRLAKLECSLMKSREATIPVAVFFATLPCKASKQVMHRHSGKLRKLQQVFVRISSASTVSNVVSIQWTSKLQQPHTVLLSPAYFLSVPQPKRSMPSRVFRVKFMGSKRQNTSKTRRSLHAGG